MLRHFRNHTVLFLAAFFVLLPSCLFATVQTTSLNDGIFHIEITSAGAYTVRARKTGWSFSGNLGVPLTRIQTVQHTDALGTYRQLQFTYRAAGLREGSFRIYVHEPILVLTMRTLEPATNSVTGAPVFPDFSSGPQNLFHLGFQPVPFGLYRFHYLGPQGPWVLFDDKANTLIVSPANHFFTINLQQHGSGFSSGVSDKVQTLPVGFTQATLMVVGSGINNTYDQWGNAMQRLAGRTAPSNEADVLLQKLSYWTDNGASYYYRFDPKLGYTGTLAAVRNKFAQLGPPLGSMQMDSWFYPKGPNADWRQFHWEHGAGGAYRYEADKNLFPNGMGAFSREVNLPLIMHGRWIDESSPYRKMYTMSGGVSIDPRYWQKTAAWLHAAHVVTYEQDWLASNAQAAINLTDPQKYHDRMAQAMQHYGLTMQYCMPAPADYMQGARYNNLTTIRTSGDRFERKKWDEFLYDSRLASALGIWPWTDVFRSKELPNLILSTLSAGPVGVGDSLDELDTKALLQSVRMDGVIVKPDIPIRPLDRIYIADAQNEVVPMIASTWSEHGTQQDKLRTTYVFAYARHGEISATIQAADFGNSGPVYVYDWRAGHGQLLAKNGAYVLPMTDGWGYAVFAPVGASGMAVLGDTEKIATAGRQRIREISDDGRLRLTMLFAPGESAQTIFIYAPQRPRAVASSGQLQSQFYDAATKLLHLTLLPNSKNKAMVEISMPVRNVSNAIRK